MCILTVLGLKNKGKKIILSHFLLSIKITITQAYIWRVEGKNSDYKFVNVW